MLLILGFLVSLNFLNAQLQVETDTLHLTLSDALTLALQNNKALKISREKIKIREAEKSISRASFFPQINLSGSYTRLSKTQGIPMTTPIYGKIPFPVYDFLGNIIGFTESIPTIIGARSETLEMSRRDNYLLRANFTQTLFSWGKLLNAYKITDRSLAIEKETYRQAEANLTLQVTQAFYQTILAQEGVRLVEESYRQLEKHLNQVNILYKNGLASELDLLQAQVQLTNLNTQLLRNRNNLDLAYCWLKNLLGVPEDLPIALKPELSDLPPVDITLDEALTVAIEKRPEIKILANTIEIMKKNNLIVKTAYLPNFFANFNYEYKRPYGFIEERWGNDYNITIGTSLPLSLGGSEFYKIKKAAHELRQVELTLAMQKELIKLEVKNAYLTLLNEKEILVYQQENVLKAEKALSLAAEKYGHGLISNLEYLTTQLQLLQAKFEALNAQINYLIAYQKLLNAMGK
jgi:outer membrane protein TolC